MASTSQLRIWWDDWRCAASMMVPLHLFDVYVGTVPPSTVDAYRQLERTLTANGYVPDSVWTYNCRNIAGTSRPSLHSYGIAVDIDPAQNPYSTGDPFTGKFTQTQIEAVEALTVDGQQLWAWGGRWNRPDRMHFQINVPPEALKEASMFVVKGDQGPQVEYWQRRLVRLGADITFPGGPDHGIDGDYGGKTAAAVQQFVSGSDGNQIGPFEAEQLDAIAGQQGRPGDPGPPGPQGPQGPTGPAGVVPDDILITIPPITVTGTLG